MVTARQVINSIKPNLTRAPPPGPTQKGSAGYDNIRDDIEKVKKLREGSIEKVPANDNDITNKAYVDAIITTYLANHPHQDVTTTASPSFGKITTIAPTADLHCATKKYVDDNILTRLDLYPIHSIFISYNITNPADEFGGTWVKLGAGKVLLGYDDDAGEGDLGASIGETGGAKTHTLTIAELAKHDHALTIKPLGDNASILTPAKGNSNPGGGAVTATAKTGSNTAHNNVQPYITVAIWRRTA